MFILQLNYPSHVQDYFAGIFPLITFDLFPTDDLYEEIFQFSELDYEEGLSEQFSIVGYEYIPIIGNMGSIFVIVVLTPFLVLI
jgi:hypothetical protein